MQSRFNAIEAPKKEGICYATTNRQEAVKSIAPACDLFLVIGAPNSSNSKRLVGVARRNGCANAYMIQRAHDIDWGWFDGVARLGLTAGASAPEVLVEEVIEACRARFDTAVEERVTAEETVEFKLPRALLPGAAA